MQLSKGQDDANKDRWYVWLDTEVSGNKRIVSDVFEINCCVKSPKYRRLTKKTEKWIRKNFDPNYVGTDPLQKIPDEGLAEEMNKQAKTSKQVQVVEFKEICK